MLLSTEDYVFVVVVVFVCCCLFVCFFLHDCIDSIVIQKIGDVVNLMIKMG